MFTRIHIATEAPSAEVPVLLKRIAGFVIFFLSAALFFRYQIANNFTKLSGDRYDGFIVLSILEHWNNVFHGVAWWSRTNYFYPVDGTLGYNDSFFIFGVIHSIFRTAGLDPFLSGELTNVVVRAIGFPAFYGACRSIIRLSWSWALLAAVLFTLSNNIFLHVLHAQLLCVSLTPLLAILVHRTLVALASDRRSPLLGWGSAFVLTFGAVLMTGFYMAWYFAWLTGITALVWLTTVGRDKRIALFSHFARQAVPLVGLAILAMAALSPFLSLYLPKAVETGMHSYDEAMSFSPSPLDVIDVGGTNLFYGRLIGWIKTTLRPGYPEFSEHTTGFPLGLLYLFGCALVYLWMKRREPPAEGVVIQRCLAVAVVITWLLIVHVGQISAYRLVYEIVPGAKATRVLARYQTFLAGPVIALAVWFLSQHTRQMSRPILAAIIVFLIAEELNISAPLAIDRPHEMHRLQMVPMAPPGCAAFFVSAARPEIRQGPAIDGIYSHNTDAMLIAEMLRLPTINGYSTFVPKGWDLTNPSAPSYREKVSGFAAQFGVTDLCSLDLRTMTWSTEP